jgi:lipopolysaccharide export system protein LptC
VKQRSYDRIAAGVSLVLLAVLAGASYYLSEVASHFELPRAARGQTHEPDYFVEKLALTKLDARGQPAFRMSARRMEHFPDDDTSEFQDPVLVSLDPGKPLVTLSADRGRATSRGEETQLYDNVVLTRAATRDNPKLEVRTDYVLILPDEDLARTDRPVRIAYGSSSLTGVGMEFNNAARVLTVHSKVHGVWAAPLRK